MLWSQFLQICLPLKILVYLQKKAIVANFSEYYKKYSDLIVFLEELDYKKI